MNQHTTLTTDTSVQHVPRQDVTAEGYSVMTQAPVAAVIPEKVYWGPIWAGFLTGLGAFLIVETFLYWVTALTLSIGPNGVVSAGPNNDWISGLIAIGAFFLGGWIAAANAPVRRPGPAAMNGLLVWSLGVGLILAGAAAGAGMFLGPFGHAFSRFMIGGGGAIAMSRGAALNFAASTQAAAGWGCLFLFLTAISAILGGYCGAMAKWRNVPPTPPAS